MPRVFAAIHIPKGAFGVPVAITYDRRVLELFRDVVLSEWRRRVELATDEIERIHYATELDRLEKILALLIPAGNGA